MEKLAPKFAFTRGAATPRGREKLFYLFLGFFMAFFAMFTFVLYPNAAALHPGGAVRVVALQVAFERQTLKPVFRLIGYRLWV